MAETPDVHDQMDEASALLGFPPVTRQRVVVVALAAQQMAPDAAAELREFLRAMAEKVKPQHQDYIRGCGNLLDAVALDRATRAIDSST